MIRVWDLGFYGLGISIYGLRFSVWVLVYLVFVRLQHTAVLYKTWNFKQHARRHLFSGIRIFGFYDLGLRA